jgi:glycosyltransferase involved in cell wall biosynthesis
MMHQPLISVIVPNYNHSQFLKPRLESIFNQSYKNIEVILLDDKSTDNSLEILSSYESNKNVSHVVFNELNSGNTFMQWAKGISLAKGEYIWIAESDDAADVDFLKKLLVFSSQQTHKLSIIYSQSFDINEVGEITGDRLEYTGDFNPNIWKKSFFMSGEQFIKECLSVKNIIPNASAVIFNREKALSINFADDYISMKICGDHLFWLEMSENGYIGFISEPLNYFRTHSKVTRIHDNYDKLLNRCLEEKKIREYIDHRYSIEQSYATKLLYERWFIGNALKSIFNSKFYSVKLHHTHYVAYVMLFIAYRFKNNSIMQGVFIKLSKIKRLVTRN